MKKFWCWFFVFWPIVAIIVCVIAPMMDWSFPGPPQSPLGQRIDGLFYMILAIVTVAFVGTHIALGYVLLKGTSDSRPLKALFTHGSHNLEVIWTIVPAGILMFISLYQLDVWAEYRVRAMFPEEAVADPIAEVTARQFEWRIRYPAPGKKLMLEPQPDDLYSVNDLHVPVGRPVMIRLRSGDVQHAFFLPDVRVKSDALPGQIIPVWFEVIESGEYPLLCAELCGWGHYKMEARMVAESADAFRGYIDNLQREQSDDGVPDETAGEAAEE